jgi:hypothetical protein
MAKSISLTNDDGSNFWKRLTAEQAGYMELSGAQKDGDCHKVQVDGGVSRELGCCNEFQPQSEQTQRFDCGDCEYVTDVSGGNQQTQESSVPGSTI